MDKRPIYTRIPVELEFPDEEKDNIMEVFDGEYESWYVGNNLVILDIGANVGSFSIWANLRWPNSRIYAYEPHPETFRMLMSNVEGLTNITCYNTAVYPSGGKELFYGSCAGDCESGLIAYIGEYYETLNQDNLFEVSVLHPRDLPVCDIIKLDVEGPEAVILHNMDVQNVSLILLEYHNDEIRNSIKELLKRDFFLEYEDNREYNRPFSNTSYKEFHYGRLFFANKYRNRLRKLDLRSLTYSWEHNVPNLSLRQLFGKLPGATKHALEWRIRIIHSYIKRLSKKV